MIKYYYPSLLADIADVTCDSTDLEHVQLNDYVAVVYDDKWFPGSQNITFCKVFSLFYLSLLGIAAYQR